MLLKLSGTSPVLRTVGEQPAVEIVRMYRKERIVVSADESLVVGVPCELRLSLS